MAESVPQDAATSKRGPAPGSLANGSRRYEVRRAELPLCCPTPAMAVWNSHPRVYLPIEKNGGEASCQYCSAQFVLVD